MKLFGTDGVRGKAGIFLNASTALKLAQAAGIYFKNSTKKKTNKILLGKDTRRSGYMIENALVSGLTSVGYNVIQVGPLPTPAVAFLTQNMRCDAGIMLSASHNPYYDNGVKFFDCNGDKLNSSIEKEIEKIFFDEKLINSSQATGKNIGKAKRIDDAVGRYIVFLKSTFPSNLNLEGIRVVLDTANGAAYKVAPIILDELGAEVITINNEPDGYNINDDCGALHPNRLAKLVKQYRADIGFALDGDADRLVVVDEMGEIVDGDNLIGSIALYLKNQNKLRGDGVVATVMSNIALENYLKKHNLNLYRSNVGDKYVLEMLKEKGLNFGGEQSGHIIFSDNVKTGDGIATALLVLAKMVSENKSASKALRNFELLPQIQKNLVVSEKIPLDKIDGLEELLNSIRKKGIRDLIRYSGTENKIRLLVEGEDEAKLKKVMDELVSFFKGKIC